MSEPARNRFALDLDDLERQLRGAAQAPKPGNTVDPLVELTRIVGQDDPLKELFAPRPAAQPMAAPQSWQQSRQEPSFAPANVQRAAAEVSAPPADIRGALDEFEALLRRTEPTRPAVAQPEPEPTTPAAPQDFATPEPYRYARPEPAAVATDAPRDLDQDRSTYQQDYGYESQAGYAEPPQSEEELHDYERPRSRKGVWAAAALIAVAVVGAAGAMVWRGSSPVSKDGQPPVISADNGPIKVQPANPGGAEIPNQNKQIYERAGGAPTGQTKVVSREEQPVDVQQAARSMPPRVVMPGPGTGPTALIQGTPNPLAQAPAAASPSPTAAGTTPSEQSLTPIPAVPGLGEPRRVRTVSIRPDGAPAPAPSTGAAYTNGGAAAPQATGSVPTRSLANVMQAPTPMPAPGSNATAAVPRPRPATPETPKAQERVATPAPATTPAAPVRVANAAPAPQNTPAPATEAIRAGTGDFVVQLAAPGSEAEARATYTALQRKYPEQLGGKPPIVRKTDLAGGKTVYRLRVGPYSRDDATTMCTALQAAGGQCFIAKN